jgi:hypothetical protein
LIVLKETFQFMKTVVRRERAMDGDDNNGKEGFPPGWGKNPSSDC